MAKKQAVRILFDNLTHASKQYKAGEIELNPTEHLINMATKGTRYFHRELREKIKVCEFVTVDTEVKEEGEYTIEMLKSLQDLDLIRILVKKFGFSRGRACSFPRVRMENYIINLQEL